MRFKPAREALVIGIVFVAIWFAGCAAGAIVEPAPQPTTTLQPPESQRTEASGASAARQSPSPLPFATQEMPGTSTSVKPNATTTATSTVTKPPPTPTPTATPTPVRPTATYAPTPTPGPTPDGISRDARVPILMYHYISDPPPDADIYRRDLSVSPALFESHLAFLVSAGYHVISLDELLYALTRGGPLPEKPVILTFDDGYEDNYTQAFPLLQNYGVAGHFFVISDFVNQGRAGYMSWSQIEEMGAAGQHIGSHSRDHPDLHGKPLDYLVWQALGGAEAIQEHLGEPPRWIAYPSGAYDAQAIAVYRSANFWGGLITQQGATHSSEGVFELHRVRVRGSHTAQDLAKLLDLDW